MENLHLSEQTAPARYRDNPPNCIFPKDPEHFRSPPKYKEKSYHEDHSFVKNRLNFEIDNVKDLRKHSSGLMRQQSERYRQAMDRREFSREDSKKYEKDTKEQYERENLTDRQKYREIVENKKHRNAYDLGRVELQRVNRDDRNYSEDSFIRTIQRKSKIDKFDSSEVARNKNTEYVERNPYREPDSLPYRQSIEKMMKSPVLKYKAKIPYERRSPSPSKDYLNGQRSGRNYNASPMSTMKRTSPKDRFQDAKEKFQAMENKQSLPKSTSARREPIRYENDYRRDFSPEARQWSSDDDGVDFSPRVSEFKEKNRHDRDARGSKSLGNLVNIKGYRHSYAEPMKYCNRVGLAAIDHY